MDWRNTFKNSISPALLGPTTLVAWLVTLWLVKRFVFHRLKKWASKKTSQWDDALIKLLLTELSLPVDLLIVASGLAIFTQFLPLSDRLDKASLMALQGCVVLACVLLVDRVLRIVVTRYATKGVWGQMSHGVLKGLVRGFVIGIGILIFLDLIGISITPILASLGIGSLAVALALQDTLSNFFAGLYVAIDRPVEEGHYVKLESGDEGYVQDIGWRTTRIRSILNHIVIIPNAKLMSSVIKNYYLPDKEIAVPIDVGIHYNSDLEKAEKAAMDVARQVMKTVPGGIPNFEPQIRYTALGMYSINFTVVLRAKEFTDSYLIKHEFIKKLIPRLKQDGIIIPTNPPGLSY